MSTGKQAETRRYGLVQAKFSALFGSPFPEYRATLG